MSKELNLLFLELTFLFVKCYSMISCSLEDGLQYLFVFCINTSSEEYVISLVQAVGYVSEGSSFTSFTCWLMSSFWLASSRNWSSVDLFCMLFLIRSLSLIVCISCSRILSSVWSPNSQSFASRVAGLCSLRYFLPVFVVVC